VIKKPPNNAAQRQWRRRIKMEDLTGLWYQVIEDEQGGLALFIFNQNEEVVYGATGYEYRPGTLVEDITAFMRHGNVENWEVQTDDTTGEPTDMQAVYDNYGNLDYGWDVIALGDYDSHREIKWFKVMGAAAKTEFGTEE